MLVVLGSEHSVRVMVTIFESDEEAAQSERAEVIRNRLKDYDERLARGEVQWQ